jgi:hypothetical protein
MKGIIIVLEFCFDSSRIQNFNINISAGISIDLRVSREVSVSAGMSSGTFLNGKNKTDDVCCIEERSSQCHSAR